MYTIITHSGRRNHKSYTKNDNLYLDHYLGHNEIHEKINKIKKNVEKNMKNDEKYVLSYTK